MTVTRFSQESRSSDHGDEAGMRPSRTSSQQSGCGSVRNVASHRHSRSLAQQVGNSLSVNVAPKRRDEAAVEASCRFLKQLQSWSGLLTPLSPTAVPRQRACLEHSQLKCVHGVHTGPWPLVPSSHLGLFRIKKQGTPPFHCIQGGAAPWMNSKREE